MSGKRSVNYRIADYATLIFDCDGVLLNSNKLKSEAFYRTALPYGHKAAQALVDYHIDHGGVSRYRKFAYFIEQIVPDLSSRSAEPDLKALIKVYADEVYKGLISCEIAGSLGKLRQSMATSRWLVVSGGDQRELREVFSIRGLAGMFDGDIFGSPDAKPDIIARELKLKNIVHPALVIGDSKFDYFAAKASNLDFIFVSDWSELVGWRDFCEEHCICSIGQIEDLLVYL